MAVVQQESAQMVGVATTGMVSRSVFHVFVVVAAVFAYPEEDATGGGEAGDDLDTTPDWGACELLRFIHIISLSLCVSASALPELRNHTTLYEVHRNIMF